MRKKLIFEYFDKSKKLHLENKEYVTQFMSLFRWLIDIDQGKGDISTKLISHALDLKKIKAKIVAKEKGILAGIDEAIFFLKRSSKIQIVDFKKDGSSINSNDVILTLAGDLSEVLTFERTILNILERLSGIATLTHQLIKKNKITAPPYLAATRKTPWMWLDKKAVSVGGGLTHRLSLADEILIKDNHLDLLKTKIQNRQRVFFEIIKTLKKIHTRHSFEIEVNSKSEALNFFNLYLKANISNQIIIMLDNFSQSSAKETIKDLRTMEKKYRNPIIIEISGGITDNNLGEYAKFGADVISLGYLTHSAKAINLSLSVISFPQRGISLWLK